MTTTAIRRLAFIGPLVSYVPMLILLACTDDATDAGDSAVSPAVELGLNDFCAKAQKTVANTAIIPRNTVYEAREDFVNSTPSVSRESLETQQFVLYDAAANTGTIDKIVSCKMKSTDRIKMMRGDEASGAEFACAVVNQDTVDQVRAGLESSDLPNVVFDPDEDVESEAQWLEPWPYKVAYQSADGVLHIRAKSLIVPFSPFSNLPAELKGNHYCHLMAPGYARALLTGAADADPAD